MVGSSTSAQLGVAGGAVAGALPPTRRREPGTSAVMCLKCSRPSSHHTSQYTSLTACHTTWGARLMACACTAAVRGGKRVLTTGNRPLRRLLSAAPWPVLAHSCLTACASLLS